MKHLEKLNKFYEKDLGLNRNSWREKTESLESVERVK